MNSNDPTFISELKRRDERERPMETDQSQLNSSLSLTRHSLHPADPNTTSCTLYSGWLPLCQSAHLSEHLNPTMCNYRDHWVKTGREEEKKGRNSSDRLASKRKQSEQLESARRLNFVVSPTAAELWASLSYRQPQQRWMWSKLKIP